MLDTIPNTHSSSKIAEHFLDSITTRLQQSALMPELEMILHRLITEDSQAVYHEQRYTAVWDTLVISCNLSEHQIGPLRAAWLAFYLAACHLDHMQDNDPIASVLEELPLSSQYTIVLAYVPSP